MQLRLTKQFSFEMAHALTHYEGLCQNIHGHSYKMDVTVAGKPQTAPDSPQLGMVMDFRELKNIVNEAVIGKMDHTLVLSDETDAELVSQLKKHYERVLVLPCQPTTENLLMIFADLIIKLLPDGVSLYSIRLQETETSFAELVL